MKKFCILALMIVVGALGCKSFDDVKEKVQVAVIALDDVADRNEAIVEKLCIDSSQVSEEEKIEAIRNARIIHIGTSELRKLITDED